MDGFEGTEGVIVIAATNRPDVLDPALLRPGRFDRQIAIDLPDVKGRAKILDVHTKKVKMDPAVSLETIARGTPGFSGAELANMVNEAAIIAVLGGKDAVHQVDLEEARDKVRFGRQKKSRVMEEEDRRIIAFHEAGHAVVNMLLENTEPLHKVSIIPRGMALGVTMMLPEKDRMHLTRKRLLDDLAVAYGGRVAEDLFCGDITAGAANDIQFATSMAKMMITEWGMSERLGPVNFADRQGNDFLGTEISVGRDHSEATVREIDEEVSKLLMEAHGRARAIIEGSKDAVVRVAEGLLVYETMHGSEIRELIDGADPASLRPASATSTGHADEPQSRPEPRTLPAPEPKPFTPPGEEGLSPA